MPVLIFIIFFILASWAISGILGAREYGGQASPHFDGRKFKNIAKENPITDKKPSLIRWILTQPSNHWQWQENHYKPKPQERVGAEKLVVTFVNHATVLIQTSGLNILTDPIWSYRASPFSFIGPKRYRNPGIPFEDLPPIDAVLISHNHYDHMDLPTLKRLAQAFNPILFCGLGNGKFLSSRGLKNVQEMDWWTTSPLYSGIIHCVTSPTFFLTFFFG